jgi:hypothetical protein
VSPRFATEDRWGNRTYSCPPAGIEDFVIPSVTTVLKALPKHALKTWAAQEVARAAIESHEMWSRMDKDAAYDMLWRAPDRKTKKGAALGSLVHSAVEAHIKGTKAPEWGPDLEGYQWQFEAFINDYEPEFLMSEAQVYHLTPPTIYAGSADLFCYIDGPRLGGDFSLEDRPLLMVGDVKTAESGIWPETYCQLQMYASAEFYVDDNDEVVEMPTVDGAFGLHLRPDHYEVCPVITDAYLWRVSQYVYEIWKWQKSHGGRPLTKRAKRKKAAS